MLQAEECRDIIIQPTPFRAPKVMTVCQGMTIKQIIDQMYDANGVPIECRDYQVMVEIDGEPLPRDRWGMIEPDRDAHVLIHALVHGGGGKKNPLRTILSIVVVVLAVAASVYFPPAMGLVKGSLAYAFASAAAATVVSTAGMMLVNAIAPVRAATVSSNSQSYSDSSTYFIQGASNQMQPFGTVPVILGKHRFTPPLGTAPYTELLGSDEYLRMLFIWGYGPLKIEDIRIGDTPIASYDEVEIETVEGRSTDAALTLMPGVVHTESIGIELNQADSATIRTAEALADELSVDIVFPSGLVYITNSGGRSSLTVSVTVQYREAGTADAWTTAYTFTVTDKTTSAVRKGYKWRVNNSKQYEVALHRTTADTDDDRTMDTVTWSVLRSIKDMSPVPFPYPLAMTALRIKATDQLQGVIENLSGLVSSYGEVWDSGTGTWGGDAVTQNPAALFRLVLMHPGNARSRTATQVNDATLGEWYEFCDTQGYKFNMVRDFRASVWDTLADIAAAGRASNVLTDGLWGVTSDNKSKPISQHITPRNSWGFKANKTLFHRPHAFRIKFNNEDEDYASDERIVYDDGYTSANATNFESIEFPGITDPDLIWKFGRYHIAQARLRPEEYTLYMDFEHLACRRGSKVRVSHDVPLWGSGWGRVKSLTVDGTDTTGVVLDDTVLMEAGKYYTCRFRLADTDNTSLVVSIDNTPGETSTLTFSTAVATATGPQVGDLAMFGEADRETAELLVKSISRADDLVAQLTLVDVSDAIYDADTGPIPAFNTTITMPTDVTRLAPAAPFISAVESGTPALVVTASGVTSRIFVSIAPSGGTVRIEKYIVRYREYGESVWYTTDATFANPTAIISPVIDGVIYEIQARAVSIYGVPSAWSGTTTETVIGQSAVPDNVTGFACNVVGSDAHLSWDAVSSIDLSHYRIRWSPVKTSASWTGSVDAVAKVSGSATSITVPALVGSYLIKAVDHAGNESATAAAAITNISSVANFNFIETITQSSPSWTGTADDTEYSSGAGGIILLAAAGVLPSDGTYELSDVVDLEAIFQCRATGSLAVLGMDINADDLYGLTDLYALTNLYSDVSGLFSAGIEIRTTNDDPAGSPTWTAYKPFLVGDYTARAFQIRLKLTGTPPNITPVVTSVTVNFDMPDRVIGFSAAVGTSGASISFSPAFYAIPKVGIAVTDGQEGDAYTMANLSETGFDIAFTNDGTAVARNITGIAKAYGALET